MVPEVLGTSADIRYTEQNANTYTNERSKTTRNHLGTYTVTTLGSRYTCYRWLFHYFFIWLVDNFTKCK